MDRLETPEWKRQVKRVTRRDKECRRKHISDCSGELQVHHLVPYRISKNDHITNLVLVCAKHHRMLENDFRRLRYLNSFGEQLFMQNVITEKNKMEGKL